MSTRMLSPAQVAEVLGVHPKTASVWMRTGHLPGRNLATGKQRACWRISEADLEKWIRNRPAA